MLGFELLPYYSELYHMYSMLTLVFFITIQSLVDDLTSAHLARDRVSEALRRQVVLVFCFLTNFKYRLCG